MFRLQFKILRKSHLLTPEVFQRYHRTIPSCSHRRQLCNHLKVPMSRKLSKLLNIFNKQSQKWNTLNYPNNTDLKQFIKNYATHSKSVIRKISKFKNCKSKKSAALLKKITKAICSKKSIIKRYGIHSGKNCKEFSCNNKLPKDSLIIKIDLPKEEQNIVKPFSNPACLTKIRSYNTLCTKYSNLQHILSTIKRNNYKMQHCTNKNKDDDKFRSKGRCKRINLNKSKTNKKNVFMCKGTDDKTCNLKSECDSLTNNKSNTIEKNSFPELQNHQSLRVTKMKKNNTPYNSDKRNRKKIINIIIEFSGIDNDYSKGFVNSTKRSINIVNDVDTEEVTSENIDANLSNVSKEIKFTPLKHENILPSSPKEKMEEMYLILDPIETTKESKNIVSSNVENESKNKKTHETKAFTANIDRNEDNKIKNDSVYNSKENSSSADYKSKKHTSLSLETDIKENKNIIGAEFKKLRKYITDKKILDTETAKHLDDQTKEDKKNKSVHTKYTAEFAALGTKVECEKIPKNCLEANDQNKFDSPKIHQEVHKHQNLASTNIKDSEINNKKISHVLNTCENLTGIIHSNNLDMKSKPVNRKEVLNISCNKNVEMNALDPKKTPQENIAKLKNKTGDHKKLLKFMHQKNENFRKVNNSKNESSTKRDSEAHWISFQSELNKTELSNPSYCLSEPNNQNNVTKSELKSEIIKNKTFQFPYSETKANNLEKSGTENVHTSSLSDKQYNITENDLQSENENTRDKNSNECTSHETENNIGSMIDKSVLYEDNSAKYSETKTENQNMRESLRNANLNSVSNTKNKNSNQLKICADNQAEVVMKKPEMEKDNTTMKSYNCAEMETDYNKINDKKPMKTESLENGNTQLSNTVKSDNQKCVNSDKQDNIINTTKCEPVNNEINNSSVSVSKNNTTECTADCVPKSLIINSKIEPKNNIITSDNITDSIQNTTNINASSCFKTETNSQNANNWSKFQLKPNETQNTNAEVNIQNNIAANELLSMSNQTENQNLGKQDTIQSKHIENNNPSNSINSTLNYHNLTRNEMESVPSICSNKNSIQKNVTFNVSDFTEAKTKKTSNSSNSTTEAKNQILNEFDKIRNKLNGIDCINPTYCCNGIQYKENTNTNELGCPNIDNSEENHIQKKCIHSDLMNKDNIQKTELESKNKDNKTFNSYSEIQSLVDQNLNSDTLNQNIAEQQSKSNKNENAIVLTSQKHSDQITITPVKLQTELNNVNNFKTENRNMNKSNLSELNNTENVTSSDIENIANSKKSSLDPGPNSNKNEHLHKNTSDVIEHKTEVVQNNKAYLMENEYKPVSNNNNTSEFKNEMIKQYIKELLLKKVKPDHRVFKVRPYVKQQYSYEEVTSQYVKNNVTNTETQMNHNKNESSLDNYEQSHSIKCDKTKIEKIAHPSVIPNQISSIAKKEFSFELKQEAREFKEKFSKQQNSELKSVNKEKSSVINYTNNQEIALKTIVKPTKFEKESDIKLIHKSKIPETNCKEINYEAVNKNDSYQNQINSTKSSSEPTKNKEIISMKNNNTCPLEIDNKAMATSSDGITKDQNAQENYKRRITSGIKLNNKNQGINIILEDQTEFKCNTANKLISSMGSTENKNTDNMKQYHTNNYPLEYNTENGNPHLKITELKSLPKSTNEILHSKQDEIYTQNLSPNNYANNNTNLTTNNQYLTETGTGQNQTKTNKQELLSALTTFNNLLSKEVTKAIEVDNGTINITTEIHSQLKKLKSILSKETKHNLQNPDTNFTSENQIEYETIKADLLNALTTFDNAKTDIKEETNKKITANKKSEMNTNYLGKLTDKALNIVENKIVSPINKITDNIRKMKKNKKQLKKIKYIVTKKFNKITEKKHNPKMERHKFKSNRNNSDNNKLEWSKCKKSKSKTSINNLDIKKGSCAMKTLQFNHNINYTRANSTDKQKYNNKNELHTAPAIFSSKEPNNNDEDKKKKGRKESRSLVNKAPGIYKVPDRQNKFKLNEGNKPKRNNLSSAKIEVQKNNEKFISKRYNFYSCMKLNEAQKTKSNDNCPPNTDFGYCKKGYNHGFSNNNMDPTKFKRNKMKGFIKQKPYTPVKVNMGTKKLFNRSSSNQLINTANKQSLNKSKIILSTGNNNKCNSSSKNNNKSSNTINDGKFQINSNNSSNKNKIDPIADTTNKLSTIMIIKNEQKTTQKNSIIKAKEDKNKSFTHIQNKTEQPFNDTKYNSTIQNNSFLEAIKDKEDTTNKSIIEMKIKNDQSSKDMKNDVTTKNPLNNAYCKTIEKQTEKILPIDAMKLEADIKVDNQVNEFDKMETKYKYPFPNEPYYIKEVQVTNEMDTVQLIENNEDKSSIESKMNTDNQSNNLETTYNILYSNSTGGSNNNQDNVGASKSVQDNKDKIKIIAKQSGEDNKNKVKIVEKKSVQDRKVKSTLESKVITHNHASNKSNLPKYENHIQSEFKLETKNPELDITNKSTLENKSQLDQQADLYSNIYSSNANKSNGDQNKIEAKKSEQGDKINSSLGNENHSNIVHNDLFSYIYSNNSNKSNEDQNKIETKKSEQGGNTKNSLENENQLKKINDTVFNVNATYQNVVNQEKTKSEAKKTEYENMKKLSLDSKINVGNQASDKLNSLVHKNSNNALTLEIKMKSNDQINNAKTIVSQEDIKKTLSGTDTAYEIEKIENDSAAQSYLYPTMSNQNSKNQEKSKLETIKSGTDIFASDVKSNNDSKNTKSLPITQNSLYNDSYGLIKNQAKETSNQTATQIKIDQGNVSTKQEDVCTKELYKSLDRNIQNKNKIEPAIPINDNKNTPLETQFKHEYHCNNMKNNSHCNESYKNMESQNKNKLEVVDSVQHTTNKSAAEAYINPNYNSVQNATSKSAAEAYTNPNYNSIQNTTSKPAAEANINPNYNPVQNTTSKPAAEANINPNYNAVQNTTRKTAAETYINPNYNSVQNTASKSATEAYINPNYNSMQNVTRKPAAEANINPNYNSVQNTTRKSAAEANINPRYNSVQNITSKSTAEDNINPNYNSVQNTTSKSAAEANINFNYKADAFGNVHTKYKYLYPDLPCIVKDHVNNMENVKSVDGTKHLPTPETNMKTSQEIKHTNTVPTTQDYIYPIQSYQTNENYNKNKLEIVKSGQENTNTNTPGPNIKTGYLVHNYAQVPLSFQTTPPQYYTPPNSNLYFENIENQNQNRLYKKVHEQNTPFYANSQTSYQNMARYYNYVNTTPKQNFNNTEVSNTFVQDSNAVNTIGPNTSPPSYEPVDKYDLPTYLVSRVEESEDLENPLKKSEKPKESIFQYLSENENEDELDEFDRPTYEYLTPNEDYLDTDYNILNPQKAPKSAPPPNIDSPMPTPTPTPMPTSTPVSTPMSRPIPPPTPKPTSTVIKTENYVQDIKYDPPMLPTSITYNNLENYDLSSYNVNNTIEDCSDIGSQEAYPKSVNSFQPIPNVPLNNNISNMVSHIESEPDTSMYNNPFMSDSIKTDIKENIIKGKSISNNRLNNKDIISFVTKSKIDENLDEYDRPSYNINNELYETKPNILKVEVYQLQKDDNGNFNLEMRYQYINPVDNTIVHVHENETNTVTQKQNNSIKQIKDNALKSQQKKKQANNMEYMHSRLNNKINNRFNCSNSTAQVNPYADAEKNAQEENVYDSHKPFPRNQKRKPAKLRRHYNELNMEYKNESDNILNSENVGHEHEKLRREATSSEKLKNKPHLANLHKLRSDTANSIINSHKKPATSTNNSSTSKKHSSGNMEGDNKCGSQNSKPDKKLFSPVQDFGKSRTGTTMLSRNSFTNQNLEMVNKNNSNSNNFDSVIVANLVKSRFKPSNEVRIQNWTKDEEIKDIQKKILNSEKYLGKLEGNNIKDIRGSIKLSLSEDDYDFEPKNESDENSSFKIFTEDEIRSKLADIDAQAEKAKQEEENKAKKRDEDSTFMTVFRSANTEFVHSKNKLKNLEYQFLNNKLNKMEYQFPNKRLNMENQFSNQINYMTSGSRSGPAPYINKDCANSKLWANINSENMNVTTNSETKIQPEPGAYYFPPYANKDCTDSKLWSNIKSENETVTTNSETKIQPEPRAYYFPPYINKNCSNSKLWTNIKSENENLTTNSETKLQTEPRAYYFPAYINNDSANSKQWINIKSENETVAMNPETKIQSKPRAYYYSIRNQEIPIENEIKSNTMDNQIQSGQLVSADNSNLKTMFHSGPALYMNIRPSISKQDTRNSSTENSNQVNNSECKYPSKTEAFTFTVNENIELENRNNNVESMETGDIVVDEKPQNLFVNHENVNSDQFEPLVAPLGYSHLESETETVDQNSKLSNLDNNTDIRYGPQNGAAINSRNFQSEVNSDLDIENDLDVPAQNDRLHISKNISINKRTEDEEEENNEEEEVKIDKNPFICNDTETENLEPEPKKYEKSQLQTPDPNRIAFKQNNDLMRTLMSKALIKHDVNTNTEELPEFHFDEENDNKDDTQITTESTSIAPESHEHTSNMFPPYIKKKKYGRNRPSQENAVSSNIKSPYSSYDASSQYGDILQLFHPKPTKTIVRRRKPRSEYINDPRYGSRECPYYLSGHLHTPLDNVSIKKVPNNSKCYFSSVSNKQLETNQIKNKSLSASKMNKIEIDVTNTSIHKANSLNQLQLSDKKCGKIDHSKLVNRIISSYSEICWENQNDAKEQNDEPNDFLGKIVISITPKEKSNAKNSEHIYLKKKRASSTIPPPTTRQKKNKLVKTSKILPEEKIFACNKYLLEKNTVLNSSPQSQPKNVPEDPILFPKENQLNKEDMSIPKSLDKTNAKNETTYTENTLNSANECTPDYSNQPREHENNSVKDNHPKTEIEALAVVKNDKIFVNNIYPDTKQSLTNTECNKQKKSINNEASSANKQKNESFENKTVKMNSMNNVLSKDSGNLENKIKSVINTLHASKDNLEGAVRKTNGETKGNALFASKEHLDKNIACSTAKSNGENTEIKNNTFILSNDHLEESIAYSVAKINEVKCKLFKSETKDNVSPPCSKENNISNSSIKINNEISKLLKKEIKYIASSPNNEHLEKSIISSTSTNGKKYESFKNKTIKMDSIKMLEPISTKIKEDKNDIFKSGIIDMNYIKKSFPPNSNHLEKHTTLSTKINEKKIDSFNNETSQDDIEAFSLIDKEVSKEPLEDTTLPLNEYSEHKKSIINFLQCAKNFTGLNNVNNILTQNSKHAANIICSPKKTIQNNDQILNNITSQILSNIEEIPTNQPDAFNFTCQDCNSKSTKVPPNTEEETTNAFNFACQDSNSKSTKVPPNFKQENVSHYEAIKILIPAEKVNSIVVKCSMDSLAEDKKKKVNLISKGDNVNPITSTKPVQSSNTIPTSDKKAPVLKLSENHAKTVKYKQIQSKEQTINVDNITLPSAISFGSEGKQNKNNTVENISKETLFTKDPSNLLSQNSNFVEKCKNQVKEDKLELLEKRSESKKNIANSNINNKQSTNTKLTSKPQNANENDSLQLNKKDNNIIPVTKSFDVVQKELEAVNKVNITKNVDIKATSISQLTNTKSFNDANMFLKKEKKHSLESKNGIADILLEKARQEQEIVNTQNFLNATKNDKKILDDSTETKYLVMVDDVKRYTSLDKVEKTKDKKNVFSPKDKNADSLIQELLVEETSSKDNEINPKEKKSDQQKADALIKLFDRAIQAIESISVNNILSVNIKKIATLTQENDVSNKNLENEAIKYSLAQKEKPVNILMKSIENTDNLGENDNRNNSNCSTKIKSEPVHKKAQEKSKEPSTTKPNPSEKSSGSIVSKDKSNKHGSSVSAPSAAKSSETINLKTGSKKDPSKSDKSQNKKDDSSVLDKKPKKDVAISKEVYESPAFKEKIQKLEQRIIDTVEFHTDPKKNKLTSKPKEKNVSTPAPTIEKNENPKVNPTETCKNNENSTSKNKISKENPKKNPMILSQNNEKSVTKSASKISKQNKLSDHASTDDKNCNSEQKKQNESKKDDNVRKVLKLKGDFEILEKILKNNMQPESKSKKSQNNITKEISKDYKYSPRENIILNESLEKGTASKLIENSPENTKNMWVSTNEFICSLNHRKANQDSASIQNKNIDLISKDLKNVKCSSSKFVRTDMVHGSVKKMSQSSTSNIEEDVIRNSIVRAISRNDTGNSQKCIDDKDSIQESSFLEKITNPNIVTQTKSFGHNDNLVLTKNDLMFTSMLTEESLYKIPKQAKKYEQAEEACKPDDNVQYEDIICRVGVEQDDAVMKLAKEEKEFIEFRRNSSCYNGFENLASSECVKDKEGTYVYISKFDDDD